MLDALKPPRLATPIVVGVLVLVAFSVWILSGGAGSSAVVSSPCSPGFVGNDMTRDSPHNWSLGEMLVPGELVALSSQVGPYCSWGGVSREDGGQGDYDLAASFAFVVGDGDERETVAWWVFYPEWDDPTEPDWDSELQKKTGDGTITYHDGYIVIVSADASDEVRRAVEATPDTGVWDAVYALSPQ